MTISVLNTTFKGLADLKLRRLSDDTLMHLPVPNNFVVENGVEERKQFSRTAQGERTHVGVYTTGKEPTLRISYSHMNAEIMAFKIGNYFAPTTKDVYINKSITLTTSGNIPAPVVTTQLGYGVAQDTDTVASIRRGDLTVKLTQVDYATFNAATPDTFSVGANFELKFSTNLVTEKQTVSVQSSANMTTVSLSDNLVGAHSLLAQLITTENKVAFFHAPYVLPSLAGSGLDFGADQVEIPLLLFTPSGLCRAYELDFTQQTVAC